MLLVPLIAHMDPPIERQQTDLLHRPERVVSPVYITKGGGHVVWGFVQTSKALLGVA
jgi:hypothetical protein